MKQFLLPADKDAQRLADEIIDHADAPGVFEDTGTMPAEAVLAVIGTGERRQKGWPFLTASKVDPNSNCRRKMMMDSWLPTVEDPRDLWARHEGGMWHKLFAELGAAAGMHTNVWLPDQEGLDDKHEKVRIYKDESRECRECEGKGWIFDCYHDERSCKVCNGTGVFTMRQIELFPNWWTRCLIDRHNDDWSVIVDHKNTKFPKQYGKSKPTDWGHRDATEKWPPQLGVYAEAVQQLRTPGKYPRCYVWRKYQGSHKPSPAFKRFRIDVPTGEKLWRLIGEHVTSFEKGMRSLREVDEMGLMNKDTIVGAMKEFPMDGKEKNMFNGWLCREGCPHKETCFGAEGLMTF